MTVLGASPASPRVGRSPVLRLVSRPDTSESCHAPLPCLCRYTWCRDRVRKRQIPKNMEICQGISSKKIKQQRQTLEIVEDFACEAKTSEFFEHFAFFDFSFFLHFSPLKNMFFFLFSFSSFFNFFFILPFFFIFDVFHFVLFFLFFLFFCFSFSCFFFSFYFSFSFFQSSEQTPKTGKIVANFSL